MTKSNGISAVLSLVLLALSFTLALAHAPSASVNKGRRSQPRAANGTRRRASKARQPAKPQQQEVVYTCPMHKEVHSRTPGECPVCKMELEVEERDDKTAAKKR